MGSGRGEQGPWRARGASTIAEMAWQQRILPVGMPLALAVAVLLPELGATWGAWRWHGLSWSTCAVLVIFLCNGYELDVRAGLWPRGMWADVGRTLGLNLLLAPVLLWLLLHAVPVSLGLLLGLSVMASVPTTLSSALVIAVGAGGDRLRALLLTVLCVIAGAFSAPLAVSLLLSRSTDVDPWPLLVQIIQIVLIPTALGAGLRLWLQKPLPVMPKSIPSLAVVSVVWTTVSAYAAEVRALSVLDLVLLLVLALSTHLGQIGVGAWLTRGLPDARRLPVVIVGAQKTVPLALALLALLAHDTTLAPIIGQATVVCVAWHFSQVFFDSLIAPRLRANKAQAQELTG